MYKTWEGPLHHNPGPPEAGHKVEKPHVANCCNSNCIWTCAVQETWLRETFTYTQAFHTHTQNIQTSLLTTATPTKTPQLPTTSTETSRLSGSKLLLCRRSSAAHPFPPSSSSIWRQGQIKLLSWRDKGQQTALQQAAATAAAMLVRTQCVCRRHFKPQDKNTPQATNRHTSECAGMRQKPCSSQEDMVSQPTECCTQLSRVATKPALWPQQNRQSHWQQQDVPPVPALD